MRLLISLAICAGALATAPFAFADTLLGSAQSTVRSVSDPLVQQVQNTVDQVQNALGPAQGPTQGPVDQTQGAVDSATRTGSGSGSPPPPSRSSPGGSGRSSGGPSPRASGGSATGSSHGGPVARRGSGGGGGTAAARRAARRLAAAAAAATGATGRPAANTSKPAPKSSGGDPVTRTFTKLVKVVPLPIKLVIALLAVLATLLGLRSWLQGRRARGLERQRQELLGDVGLLQRALLPEVPEKVGPLATSVAYRPADGPAAGGDFYDVFEIDRGRVAIIVGDVCGHGRQALAQTALIRYTLRAYIDAGMGPRSALQVAGRALANDLAGELTTVVVAVYDPAEATLAYACAGHEPPILLGAPAHEPVIAGAAPPVGAGVDTGMRETRVPLGRGSTACFFTDGLVEARVEGGMVGRPRLSEMLSELGEGEGARDLLARIAKAAQHAPDDMAACIVEAVEGNPITTARIEELEIRAGEESHGRAARFLAACGIEEAQAAGLLRDARVRAAEFGTVVLRVTIDGGEATAEVDQPDMRGMIVLPPVQRGDAPDTVAL
jgi:hypothetical protein